MQNGICEAFNGRMRDELLNETIFYDLDHARSALARWTAAYNQKRPPLSPRLSHPRGLRGNLHRNERSAAHPRPAPTIARCSLGPHAPTSTRDSSPGWMNFRGHSNNHRGRRLSPTLLFTNCRVYALL
jgi:Integrase core domain